MIYRRLFDFPTLRLRSPFGELERMRRQMDRLFEDAMTPYQRPQTGVFPLINLTEDKDNYYVRAELPGVKADELDIQVTANNLAISGERKIAAEEEGARYHRREREAGTFSRMIALPGEIDSDKVDANLENGILTIVISKAEIAKPKQISVSS
ncbi:MAG: Hsp20/alpha crystallin family protein [Desulfobacterales bacterium]|nr:MAG: Hsp20/alpha crystallin family protein [Desulfobacterales bacterium]